MVLNNPKGGQGPPPKDVKVTDNRKTRLFQYADTDRLYLAQEDQQASKWSAFFLPTIGLCLLTLGISLVIVGSVNDKADVIVLGVMFLIGSVMFFVLMYTVVCKPLCQRNQVDPFSYIDSAQSDDDFVPPPRPLSEPPAYSVGEYVSGEHKRAKPGLVPRDSVLYSPNKSRSFLATPATSKDVNFDEGLETPPPPRLALPKDMLDDPTGHFNAVDLSDEFDVPGPAVFDPGESAPDPAVYDEDKHAVRKKKEIAALELL